MTISQRVRDEIAASGCVTCKWLLEHPQPVVKGAQDDLTRHRQRFHPVHRGATGGVR